MALFAGDPGLADLAESGDLQRLRDGIKRGDNVNAAQSDGMTALHWAVLHDELGAARELLKAGADAHSTNRYGVTPLALACQNGHGALVRLLLEAGADPNVSLAGGETPLMIAARTGRIEPVEALLSQGAQIEASERKGQTALMWAAAEGHVHVVERLLKAGATMGRTLPDSGFTAFFFAVREGQTEVVQSLLRAGAEVNGTLQPQRNFRRAPRKGTSALLLAVENGHFELALHLLKAGADPNDQRSGFTALHALTWVRKPNRGDGEDGDPSPTGSGRLTSLQLARELVVHGADVNARLQKGRSGKGQMSLQEATPFLMAAKTADLPFLKLLLELGADPTLGNADGCTPLMAAAGVGTMAPGEEAGTEEEALATVAFLLASGADVNVVDQNGETAMHGAAYKNLPRMVEFLAANGADADVSYRTNRYGWTPLRIAEGYRVGNFKPSPETMDALLRVMRAAGVTPPDPAAAAGRLEVYP